MPDSRTVALVIIGMAITNFAIRLTPMALLSRVELPRPMMRWLSFVPVSVMGALVATEVMRPGGEWLPPLSNPGIPAAVTTALVFRLTRSFLGSTIAGMVAYTLLAAVM